MPITAAPGNIWFPDNTAPVSPLENLFSQMATSVNTMGSMILQATPSLVASDAARAALFPTPAQGNSVIRSDKGWIEMYFAAYNATSNLAGVRTAPAGWYPISGNTPYVMYGKSAGGAVTSANTGVSQVALDTTTMQRGLGGAFTNSSGSITCAIAGFYQVNFQVEFSANSDSARRQARLFQNGNDIMEAHGSGAVQAGGQTATAGAAWSGYLAAGDVLTLNAGQGSGSTLTVNNLGTYLAIEMSGPI